MVIGNSYFTKKWGYKLDFHYGTHFRYVGNIKSATPLIKVLHPFTPVDISFFGYDSQHLKISNI